MTILQWNNTNNFLKETTGRAPTMLMRRSLCIWERKLTLVQTSLQGWSFMTHTRVLLFFVSSRLIETTWGQQSFMNNLMSTWALNTVLVSCTNLFYPWIQHNSNRCISVCTCVCFAEIWCAFLTYWWAAYKGFRWIMWAHHVCVCVCVLSLHYVT